MKIRQVLCAAGRSGYLHLDLLAIKAGAKADGGIFHGPTVGAGFKKIAEPASILSVMLVLEDGQVAFGDCADVIFAGVAGRDPLFDAEAYMDTVKGPVAEVLTGQDASVFRPMAGSVDAMAVGGKRLHTALRYGITQALLHAASLANRQTMAEVISREYGTPISKTPIGILASLQNEDIMQLDRMVLKRVELLPHAYFTTPEEVGAKGEKLSAWVRRIAGRIQAVGEADYRPRFHVDVYGTLGEVFKMDVDAIADYIGTLREAAAPYELLVESPVIARTQAAQIEVFGKLRGALNRKGIPVRIIADEWCNTREDIGLFADAHAADYVQIKTPDLGGINNTIESVLYCRRKGVGACLGGTGNETDQSARISTHIGLACQPDFMLSKPGLGGDEALMIQSNEMARTLAILQSRN